MIKKLLDIINQKLVANRCKKWTNKRAGIFYASSRVINISQQPECINIGLNTHVRGELLIFANGGKITIGNNTYVGEGCRIWSAEKIEIGNNVLISHGVNIIDTNSHELDYLERANGFSNLIKNGHSKEKNNILTAPIVIEDYAWISFNAIILKGIRIGKGAIVAAGSVVTKDVAPFTVVAGNPAQLIKTLSNDDLGRNDTPHS